MTRSAHPIDPDVARKFLQIVENEQAMISGRALRAYDLRFETQLITRNLLKESGARAVGAGMDEHEDQPIALQWSPERGGHVHVNAAAEVTVVPDRDLLRYRADFEVLLAELVVSLDFRSRGSAVELVPGHVWEIGDLQFKGRKTAVPLWFGRQLFRRETWMRLQQLTRARPTLYQRAILTTTPAERLFADELEQHVVIPITDVMDPHRGLAVYSDILQARIEGRQPRPIRRPIELTPDGYLLVNGATVCQFRSDKHKRMIKKLIEGFEQGRRFKQKEILEAGGSNSDRLSKAFGPHWDTLQPYLIEEDGLWGFSI